MRAYESQSAPLDGYGPVFPNSHSRFAGAVAVAVELYGRLVVAAADQGAAVFTLASSIDSRIPAWQLG